MFEEYTKLHSLFLDIEKRAKGIIVIFGSYANFTSNERSDLDLFLIGTITETEDLENLYNIKINVIKSKKNKVKSNDLFINEIVKNHIIIKGIEEFIDMIW